MRAAGLDAEAMTLEALGPRGIPLTLLFDAGGTVRRRYAGELDEQALATGVAALLSGIPVDKETSR
ncbi:MAG: hypothetical protein EOO24_18775 [Comamonadaceae bacterium]|nr:MAG: hypothetical protein EOO24_18775 [Comamonadaceae bacterium]